MHMNKESRMLNNPSTGSTDDHLSQIIFKSGHGCNGCMIDGHH